MFAFAFYGDYGHIVPCKKGFFHRCTDHTKHFFYRNKKPILIGVAVAVAVVVVVAVVATAPAAVPALEGAAAVAAAGASGAATDKPTSSRKDEDSPGQAVTKENQENSDIRAAVEERVASFKETVVEETLLKPTREMTIADTARDMGSSLAHEILDGVGQLVAIIPDGLDEIDRIASAGAKFLPECFQDHVDNPWITGNRTENFEKTLTQGHQAIDQIFATDQAPRYSKEMKEFGAQLREELGMSMAIGIIPPPGAWGSRAGKLGFNTREIAQLENMGKMEGSIAKNVPNTAQDINFANHALQRAVEREVSRESISEALASPLKIEEVKIDNLGRPSQRFIGQKAEVVINPETQQVVSVNPTSTKKFEKLNNELSNVKDRAE